MSFISREPRAKARHPPLSSGSAGNASSRADTSATEGLPRCETRRRKGMMTSLVVVMRNGTAGSGFILRRISVPFVNGFESTASPFRNTCLQSTFSKYGNDSTRTPRAQHHRHQDSRKNTYQPSHATPSTSASSPSSHSIPLSKHAPA